MMHRIMVLDDDDQVRDSLVFFLEDEGFDVLGAVSGEDALEKLSEDRIEVVVVDLRLPGMDGTAFIHEAHKKWPDLSFVMYTGSPEFRIPEDLAALGCVSPSLFLKPLIEPEAMSREITRLISE